MKNALGCIVGVIIVLIITVALNALLAWPITWALNTWTPLHPTYQTVFVILLIVSVVFGGGSRARSK